MSDQNIKDMGNLSRASGEIRKKLELSFAPIQEQTKIDKNTEINKSANTEVPISGNSGFGPASINTEIGIDHFEHRQSDPKDAVSMVGCRYKKIVPRTSGSTKAKATFCLDTVAVEQLSLIYIKRLSTRQKSDRSSLICEAISLLFEKEKPF